MTLMLLFWVAAIFVVVYAIRTFGHDSRARNGGNAAEDRALATLRERYARGEIDHAEYEERLRPASGKRSACLIVTANARVILIIDDGQWSERSACLTTDP